jgi:PEP-CTERM motif-containing protein
MKRLLQLLASCAVVGTAVQANAQTVTVDPTTLTLGFMNWSPAPGDAAGYGGSGNSTWALSALPATFSGSTLTLAPNVNVYAPGVPYWVNADGSGANIMDANVYNETAGTYVGTTLTFQYDVLANTLVSPYTSIAFIKDFAPDYSSFVETTANLTPGLGSISLLTSANAGDHIQYGFETDGPDANPATVAALGTVVIGPTPTPEPSTLALIGVGVAGILGLRRARRA